MVIGSPEYLHYSTLGSLRFRGLPAGLPDDLSRLYSRM